MVGAIKEPILLIFFVKTVIFTPILKKSNPTALVINMLYFAASMVLLLSITVTGISLPIPAPAPAFTSGLDSI